MRTKRRKKLASRARVPPARATAPQQRWSMDFVHDRLIDGRAFRVLTVIDQFTRECVALVAASTWRGEGIVRLALRAGQCRDAPSTIPLPSASLSVRNHQPRRVVVPQILSELPGCRGSSGRTRHHRVVRNHSAVVREVRPRLRPAIDAPTKTPRRYVVPGRSLRHDQRSAPVSVARRGSRRGPDRPPRPIPPGRGAARRFFRKLLQSQRQEPSRLVTDKLGSYRVAHRVVMPLVPHDTRQYANNRAEVSHQPTRQRERQMRGSTSPAHAQRFLHVHGVIQNLFRVGRHLLRAVHHRMLRARSFTVWAEVTAA